MLRFSTDSTFGTTAEMKNSGPEGRSRAAVFSSWSFLADDCLELDSLLHGKCVKKSQRVYPGGKSDSSLPDLFSKSAISVILVLSDCNRVAEVKERLLLARLCAASPKESNQVCLIYKKYEFLPGNLLINEVMHEELTVAVWYKLCN